MLVYQKTMFDRYYCIKKAFVTWKHASISPFCITIMARKSMKDSKVLKKPVPEQTCVILTSLNYFHFYTRYF